MKKPNAIRRTTETKKWLYPSGFYAVVRRLSSKEEKRRLLLRRLGVVVDSHGKMPDAVLYYPTKNWLILVESVTSHGPVDGKRHDELMQLLRGAKPGPVYVTAFPTRSVMARYLSDIAWETEMWVADAPSHLIHFNGIRFLGPYPTRK